MERGKAMRGVFGGHKEIREAADSLLYYSEAKHENMIQIILNYCQQSVGIPIYTQAQSRLALSAAGAPHPNQLDPVLPPSGLAFPPLPFPLPLSEPEPRS